MTSLLIDAGSTKTDWAVIDERTPAYRQLTKGINPNYLTVCEMDSIIGDFTEKCPSRLSSSVSRISYYGSGCAKTASAERVADLLRTRFPNASVSVNSDLLGACRAVCEHESGLVAILGTGAAACLYDGEKIVTTAPSLGFMLGDEGSGTHLGKNLIIKYLNHSIPADIRQDMEERFHLNETVVLQKLYREEAPNRFMASLAPFIGEHLSHPFIKNLCRACFRAFFEEQISYFSDYQNYRINIVGSIGYHFQDIIRECAKEKGICVGNIEAAPMPKLIQQEQQL